MDKATLKETIRDVADFPKPGIIFKDITTLLNNPEAFAATIDIFHDHYKDKNIQKILGIEARGFIFGSALAYKLQTGLNIFRKPGKLPYKTFSNTYELEYGTDTIEIHTDAVAKNERVLIIDDLIATGGTARAAADLVQRIGGTVVGLAFVMELSFLHGTDKLKDYDVYSILTF